MTETAIQKNNDSKTAPKAVKKAVRSKIVAGEEYVLDAAEKKIGRIASEAAKILLGKNRTDFAKNTVAAVKVKIINASKMLVPAKKKEGKVYARYSGYPGGLRYETLGHLIDKKGYGEALYKAVYGMLPGNRLRAKRIKNLIVSE